MPPAPTISTRDCFGVVSVAAPSSSMVEMQRDIIGSKSIKVVGRRKV
jgi:hypothetical protein